MPDDFLRWGRLVVNGAASLLENEIPGARRGNESRLADYEALYVHFQDAHVPQPLAIWLFATRAGAPYNVRGYGDVVGAGLKHDSDAELDRGAWKFRVPTPFAWRKHVDDRWEGYRWLCRATELPDDAEVAGRQVAERVLSTLRRTNAIP